MNILLVENDPDLRRAIDAALTQRGQSVTACADAESAWDAYQRGRYPLVLTDWHLPGPSDGLGLCQRIRRQPDGDRPVILVMTARDQPGGLEEVLEAGADDYLAKPFELGSLEVRLAVARRRVAEVARRTEAEAALRESEERLQLALAAGSMGTWDWDIRTGTVAWSRSLETVHGLPPGRVSSGGAFDLDTYLAYVHPDDRERVTTTLQRTLAAGRDYDVEYRIVWPDGSIRWIQGRGRLLRDDRGQPLRMGGVCLDVTPRKQAEEALARSNRDLAAALEEVTATQQAMIQQERLRALGEMASGIAHDFNNTLTPIVGFSELLLDQPETLANPDRVRMYLEWINTAAQSAASVISRLHEFYRHRDARDVLAPTDVNHVVRQVVALTQPRWKDQAQASGAMIRVETALGDIPPVLGDEAELREALANLVFNAVDAMPTGGVVTLRTRADGAWVAIEVADTGLGMTAEVRRRCLEPFFTTKGHRGTGMGLAMVYGTVQRHKGTVGIESDAGRGTSVVIRLPMVAQRGPESSHPAAGESGAWNAPLRILVVEDQSLVRQVVTEYLTRDGHIVEGASNGHQGLRAFLHGHFDLVVADCAMPEMNGDRLAAAIKQKAPDTPIILLTGFGDVMAATGDSPVGVDLVLGKPVTQQALRGAILRLHTR